MANRSACPITTEILLQHRSTSLNPHMVVVEISTTLNTQRAPIVHFSLPMICGTMINQCRITRTIPRINFPSMFLRLLLHHWRPRHLLHLLRPAGSKAIRQDTQSTTNKLFNLFTNLLRRHRQLRLLGKSFHPKRALISSLRLHRTS